VTTADKIALSGSIVIAALALIVIVKYASLGIRSRSRRAHTRSPVPPQGRDRGALLQERRCGCQPWHRDGRDHVTTCQTHGGGAVIESPRDSFEDAYEALRGLSEGAWNEHAERKLRADRAEEETETQKGFTGDTERALHEISDELLELASYAAIFRTRDTDAISARLCDVAEKNLKIRDQGAERSEDGTAFRAGEASERVRIVSLLDDAVLRWEANSVGSFAQACVLGQLRRLRHCVVEEPLQSFAAGGVANFPDSVSGVLRGEGVRICSHDDQQSKEWGGRRGVA